MKKSRKATNWSKQRRRVSSPHRRVPRERFQRGEYRWQKSCWLRRKRTRLAYDKCNPASSPLLPVCHRMAHWLELSAALDALWTEMQPLVPEDVAQRRGEPATFADVLAHLVADKEELDNSAVP